MSNLIKGINPYISNELYHADRSHISSSGIKELYWDPNKYEKNYILGQKEPMKKSNGLDEGSAIHLALLEPHLYDKQVAIFPDFRKVGKAFEQFEAANIDKIILSQGQQLRIDNMVKAFKARPEAVEMLNRCEKEVTVCSEILGIKVKIRADGLDIENGIIADIKSSGFSVEHEIFKQNAYSQLLSYDISAALYELVCEQEFGKPFKFNYIAISKQDYVCHIYKASDIASINGRNKIFKALEKLNYYRSNGKWPESGKKVEPIGNYVIREL